MQQQQYYPPNNGGYAQVPGPQQQYQQQQQPYGQPPPAQSQFQYEDQKVPFEQAFKVERPKWNDVWAGILFLLFMMGFTVVSGIALHGYGMREAKWHGL